MKIVFFVFFLFSFFMFVHNSCAKSENNEVVVYTSVDKNYSEVVFKEFAMKTGIKVKAVYDAEVNKSAGLANRLIAEKSNPQADVFWSGEPLHIINLKEKGILEKYESPSANDIPQQFKDPENYWTGFSGRVRVLIFNKDLIRHEDVAHTIHDLTKPKFKNKFAIANPMFGTTTFHFVSLFSILGEIEASDLFKKMKSNGARIVDGNSVVRKLVELGEIELGLTDSDDADLSVANGNNIGIVYPKNDSMGTLFVPNMTALIKNGPNTSKGKKFIDYLLSKDAEQLLSSNGWLKISVREVFDKEKMKDISFLIVEYEKIASISPYAIKKIKMLLDL